TTDGAMGLPGGGHRLVRTSYLLHGGDEPHGRGPGPAPLLGDEQPHQADVTHLAQNLSRTAALGPSLRRLGADLFFGDQPPQADERSFVSGETEIPAAPC